MNYKMYYDIFAVIVCLLFFIDVLRVKVFPRPSAVILKVLLAVNICCCLLKMLNFTSSNTDALVVGILSSVYTIAQSCVILCMFLYCLLILDILDVIRIRGRIAILAPLCIYIITVIIGMATGYFYTVQEGMTSLNVKYLYAYSAISSLYTLMAIVCFILFAKKIRGKEITALIGVVAIYILVIVLQLTTKWPSLMGYSVVPVVAILYFGVERPAYYVDAQTGQPNSSAFNVYVDQKVRRNAPFDCLFVQIIDYDRFASLLGIEEGERLLNAICNGLAQSVGKYSFFKLEQDRFAICITDGRIDYCYELIRNGVMSSCIAHGSLNATCSALALSYPKHFESRYAMQELLQYCSDTLTFASDKPLYKVDDALLGEYHKHRQLESTLYLALAQDKLDVYYQPIVDITNGSITSCEALVRLFDENGRVLPTDKVIEIAERNGSILTLGDQVLKKVCRFIQQYIYTGILDFSTVCINMSAVQCMQNDYATRALKIMEEYGVDGSSVCFELTETTLGINKKTLTRQIDLLRDRGVEFACDDYGTGYSTSSYIITFPFSTIKFDRSLVQSFCTDRVTQLLLGSEIYTCIGLGLTVVMEGVETKEQVEFLKQRGIKDVQGYYFARPQCEEDFVTYAKGVQSALATPL